MNLIVIGDIKNGKYYMRLCNSEGDVLNDIYGVSKEIIDETTGDADYLFVQRAFSKSGKYINVILVDDTNLIME